MRWIEATFPFTHPSWELEIEYRGTWYEVLVKFHSITRSIFRNFFKFNYITKGCGILEQEILKNGEKKLILINQII